METIITPPKRIKNPWKRYAPIATASAFSVRPFRQKSKLCRISNGTCSEEKFWLIGLRSGISAGVSPRRVAEMHTLYLHNHASQSGVNAIEMLPMNAEVQRCCSGSCRWSGWQVIDGYKSGSPVMRENGSPVKRAPPNLRSLQLEAVS